MTDLQPQQVRTIKQNPGPQLSIEKSIEKEVSPFALAALAAERQMNPVALAILAAVTKGLLVGVTEVSKQAVVDAYNLLKNLLKQKFGEDSPFVIAVAELEAAPHSQEHRKALQEKAVATKVDADPEVLKAAQDLLAQIKAQPGGEQHIQIIIAAR